MRLRLRFIRGDHAPGDAAAPSRRRGRTRDDAAAANRWRYLLLLPLAVVAVVSLVLVRGEAGEGQLLLQRQREAQALTAQAVDRVVRVAPDPVTRHPGLSAGCASLGNGVLRNPWTCTIHYRSGRVITYRVTIHADGSYLGDDESVSYRGRRYHDTGTITGCCISIP